MHDAFVSLCLSCFYLCMFYEVRAVLRLHSRNCNKYKVTTNAADLGLESFDISVHFK